MPGAVPAVCAKGDVSISEPALRLQAVVDPAGIAAAPGKSEGSTPRKPTARALRTELAPMKTSLLRKRARAAGVEEDAIDETDEADDPRAALV
eukprot:SAG22_NODE_17310_length_307_cov_0.831731_1_plen_92_part_10